MSYDSHTVHASEGPHVPYKCDGYEIDSKVLYAWKEQCPPPKPWKPCQSPLCPLDIERRSEDAVVRIFTQTGVTAAVSAAAVTTGAYTASTVAPGPQTPDNSFDSYYTFGNGFRTKNGLIVCPAHLVLLPPNVLQVYTTFPNPAAAIDPLPNGNAVQRVGRILVDISNVNGSGYAFTYEAHVYGVDGACDVALLYIPGASSSSASDFNAGLPLIKKCHPHLEFGCSREYRNTEPAYVVGDVTSTPSTFSANQGGAGGGVLNASSRGILVTTVNEYRHTDYVGLIQPEVVILNGNAYCSSGAPILDKYGHVIGMQTLATCGTSNVQDAFNGIMRTSGNGLVGGPSQFSMIRSLTLLDQAVKGFVVPQAESILDPLTGVSFYLLGHAYLGIAWDLVTGSAFGSYISNLSGYQVPLTIGGGVYTDGPDFKQVVGVRVRALAGDVGAVLPFDNTVQYIAVPGATSSGLGYTNFTDSPLLGQVFPNDIIYDINCMAIGDIGAQAALSLALWALSPGDPVTLKIRSFNGVTQAASYNVIKTVTVELATMPRWMNFPWYKYTDLPVGKLFSGASIALRANMPLIEVASPGIFAPYFPSI